MRIIKLLITEIVFGILFLMVIVSTISPFLVIGIIILMMAILLIIHTVSKFKKFDVIYNPFLNAYELHLGRKGNYKTILRVLRYAKKQNKDIVFCTNLFSKEKLESFNEKHNVSIKIKQGNWLRSFVCKFYYIISTLGKRKQTTKKTVYFGRIQFEKK